MLSGRKTTVKALQKLTGFLNFLCRCIVPGRAFTRRLYANFNSSMKPHYHINIKQEMHKDLAVWQQFLNSPGVYSHPFLDYTEVLSAEEIFWYTDAYGKVGFGGVCESHWMQGKWDRAFLLQAEPSIEFQELFAICASVLCWACKFRNKRICLFCDNTSVVSMINNTSSSCKNCMTLIRKMVLVCMDLNVRIFAKYVRTAENKLADALSRFQNCRFWREVEADGRQMEETMTDILTCIWPVEKIWID